MADRKKISSGKRNILIVEDDPINREILKSFLSEKYHILEAENGQQGIEILQAIQENVAAVLLDLVMPVMDGYTFLNIIANDTAFSKIPIVVMSAYTNGEDEEYCLRLGASDFIPKPYNIHVVKNRIHNIIKLNESIATVSAVEYDDLTGLYSRQYFIHKAEKIRHTNKGKNYSIFGIDIENFKMTNNEYGEKRCNDFLVYIGDTLTEKIPDGIVTRFGGDRFAVMFETDNGLTSKKLEAILKELTEQAPIKHQVINAGVYFNIDINLPIIRCCDRAFIALRTVRGMYRKNIAVYTEEMHNRLLKEQQILEDMEDALEQNEFKVYYQPKHDSITGKLVGAEALVRWQHPRYGMMSPGLFIPLFEKNGFITKLDSFVAKKVCADQKRWKDSGINIVPVSINVSRRDFYEEGWMSALLDVIEDSGLMPADIHAEVTESMYAENAEQIISQLKRVQEDGYCIEMDDFGTGYSSLGMLTEFPLNYIKLDISFIRKLERTEVVVESVIELAHKMGFKVVAEGVENDIQLNILKRLNCDYIQGFLFSKPLPVDEFEKYMRAM